MGHRSEVIHHFTEFSEFEKNGLENKGLAFPELEKVMHDYILSQPKETMEFKECWVNHQQGEKEDMRTVQVIFLDHNMKNYIRLWGAKSNEDGRVLKMVVDAIDPETEEKVYERQLA